MAYYTMGVPIRGSSALNSRTAIYKENLMAWAGLEILAVETGKTGENQKRSNAQYNQSMGDILTTT